MKMELVAPPAPPKQVLLTLTIEEFQHVIAVLGHAVPGGPKAQAFFDELRIARTGAGLPLTYSQFLDVKA